MLQSLGVSGTEDSFMTIPTKSRTCQIPDPRMRFYIQFVALLFSLLLPVQEISRMPLAPSPA